MSCSLTTGYTIDCADSVGGLRKLYVGRLSELASVTVATGTNIVTAISMDETYLFRTYELHRETASISEDIVKNASNGSTHYVQKLKFQMRKMSAASRNEIRLLAQNRLLFVAEDRNGKYWLLGYDTADGAQGLEMVNSTAASGTAMADLNGYELNFEGMSELPMYEVSSSVISVITTAAL